MSLLEWGAKFEDMDYKIIKQDQIDRYFISTVWLGLNHALFRKHPPMIFETMIFVKQEEGEPEPEDPWHLYQQRYSTEEEARKGHDDAVSTCQGEINMENRIKALQSQEVGNETDSQ